MECNLWPSEIYVEWEHESIPENYENKNEVILLIFNKPIRFRKCTVVQKNNRSFTNKELAPDVALEDLEQLLPTSICCLSASVSTFIMAY